MSALHPKEYLVLPNQLSYAPKTHDRGLVFTKQTVKLFPETQGPFNPADTTTFRIANMAKAIDPRTLQLHFCVNITPSAAAFPTVVPIGIDVSATHGPQYALVDDSAHSLLKTVTVRLGGGFQQDRVTDYNRVRNSMATCTVPEAWKRGLWGRAQGYHMKPLDETAARLSDQKGRSAGIVNDGSQRRIYGLPDSKGYETPGSILEFYQEQEALMQDSALGVWRSIPLDAMSLFSQEKFIYLPAIGGELNIDILWEDANKVLWVPESAAQAATYQIGLGNSCYLSYDTVSLTEAYVVGLTKALSSGGINYDTEKYYCQKFIVGAGGDQSTDYRIQKRFQSAKSAFVFFNEIVDTTAGEWSRPNKTSTFITGGVSRYQFTVDGLPITHPINIGDWAAGGGQIAEAGFTNGTSGNTTRAIAGAPPMNGQGTSEAAFELAKALRLAGDTTLASGLRLESFYNNNYSGFNGAANPRGPTQTAIYGCDLERTGAELSGRGMDEIVFSTTFSPVVGTELYFLIVYDSRLVVEAGSRFTLVE